MKYVIALYHTGKKLTFRHRHSRVHHPLPEPYCRGYETCADAFRAWLQHEGYAADLVSTKDSYQRIEFKDVESQVLFLLRWPP